MAVGALDPSLFARDFAMGHIAGGVTILINIADGPIVLSVTTYEPIAEFLRYLA
jgi:hypothetical protein